MLRIGVDTGGTFTDFVFSDGKTIRTHKLPSTPEDPARSIHEGLDNTSDTPFELVHGTTVATNAFLQKRLARGAFLCTRGFEHILFIGRQNRVNLFSLQARKPFSLVPLSRCYGIPERTLPDGKIMQPVVSADLRDLAVKLRRQKVTTVGIVFLHSYRNPENEAMAARFFRDRGFQVTASSEIIPEYREYERAVVTMLNVTLKPIIGTYINRLRSRLNGNRLFVMQSSGGVLSPGRIVQEPVRTMMSGPAGGVIAAGWLAGLKRYPNIITLDMGGTSTDVSIIKDGKLLLTRDGSLDNLPLHIPIIDIVTVGAGGGSIARIDRGGVLQVGPESAGAVPGPACYGKSMRPTVTDACVVNGIIRPELFLGGKMNIYPGKSRQAIQKIAGRIGKNLHETAEGILHISVSSMEKALRSVTLEKGEDPRFYTLLPFGGAGGMVAPMLAERLGIRRILIPPFQGVFSALGMLVSDYQKEFTRSILEMVSGEKSVLIQKVFSELEGAARRVLRTDGFSDGNSAIRREVDIRYRGQSFEITVPFGEGYIQDFHRRHQVLYSYCLGDGDCEIVNARVVAIGRTRKLDLPKKRKRTGNAPILGKREVYTNGKFQTFHLYRRRDIFPGCRLRGSAVVVSDDATVLIDRNFKPEVDEYSNIILTRMGKNGRGSRG